MAKRKRLTPPGAGPNDFPEGLETKSLFQSYPLGVAPKSRAPIAQVAGDAAARSALEEVAGELQDARRNGRMVQSLPLASITADHLVRDRMTLDSDEMNSLKASLRTRGQQTPIEVVDLGEESYGLISGWRRLEAFRALMQETGDARFGAIQALIKPIETVSDSYVAMVEENEIRASLSFYERAHLACEAARLGIYRDPAEAIATLFANAPSARRSKIGSFVRLHQALGKALRFPEAIPEKLGLAMVAACDRDRGFSGRLRDALRKTPPGTPEEERAAIERALKKKQANRPEAASIEIGPALKLVRREGRAVVSGKAVTSDLLADLETWLKSR